MIEQLRHSDLLKAFQEALQKNQPLLVEELWDAPKAALLAVAEHALKRPILVLSSGVKEDRLQGNSSYFGLHNVFEFPSWETLPGEEIAPSPDIMGKRLEILHAIEQKNAPFILFSSLQSCLQKTLPPKQLQNLCRRFQKKDVLPYETIPELLKGMGYRRAAVVSYKGEYALRHGILDIFPISEPDPIRLEFFGDEIEDIRHFDPVSQKSMGKQEDFLLTPASEFELLHGSSTLASLIDYLPSQSLIVFNGLVELEDRYVALKTLPGSQSRFFLSWADFLESTKNHKHLYFSEHAVEEITAETSSTPKGRAFYSGKTPFSTVHFEIVDTPLVADRFHHPFCPLQDFFSPLENRAASSSEELLHGLHRMRKESLYLYFVSANEAEEQTLKSLLEHSCPHLPENTTFTKGYLASGFVLTDTLLTLFPMTELTHRYQVRRQKWRGNYHTPASEFHALEPGDVVVHFHHGIGRFLGIEKLANHLSQTTEFLVIEYAEQGKLYVPISQAHLLSRYIGAHEEIPSFHVIGDKQWQRTRTQAEKAIVGYAQDLLKLQAERVLKGGFSFTKDTPAMQNFEAEFPYAATEDQIRAIADIKNDMEQITAMDRLICGDVGYGKTEVAMRAAFKAISCGQKQVAVLVPTTVLALQHFETFKARMSNFPIRIGVVSRFQKPSKIKQILKETAEGNIDILIGTHRIISQDVRFANLGLIIIDEEQRFGVRAKEHLKALKIGVDCLTLSATPIPRTLYMSLIGTKMISVINTPPYDRLPIKSLIAEREPSTIRNALLRELSRDGQAFFIHNRVETIFQVQKELHEFLPEAKIVVAHGQMAADEIDTVFHAFKNGEADILVATTIVENGVDIPNANTILIDHADKFGLADLYQMRGRVGRWNRPAYAYFLTPLKRTLNELSRKRLFALIESSGYGGGMKIAMRDLEIRGAGDILGTQQSGQIATIGFHLYCKLLKRAIDSLQKKQALQFCETKMEFSFDARLPEDYISETSLRMEIYHRFGDSRSFEEIDALLEELKDRFGPIPEPVSWLSSLTKIKIAASKKNITLLQFKQMTLTIERGNPPKSSKSKVLLPSCKTPKKLEEQLLSIL